MLGYLNWAGGGSGGAEREYSLHFIIVETVHMSWAHNSSRWLNAGLQHLLDKLNKIRRPGSIQCSAQSSASGNTYFHNKARV